MSRAEIENELNRLKLEVLKHEANVAKARSNLLSEEVDLKVAELVLEQAKEEAARRLAEIAEKEGKQATLRVLTREEYK